MKKLAYAIIASTGLLVSAFSPNYVDRCVGAFAFIAFGICTIATNEKEK